MKDFFDIWLLSRQFEFDGTTLAAAITKTFANRETDIQPQPVALTNAFAEDSSKEAQWRAFVRKSRLEDVPGDLREVILPIAVFLQPLATALSESRSFQGTWHPPGPWAQTDAQQ